MRTRKEIQLEARTSGGGSGYIGGAGKEHECILEVLLDLRDLLAGDVSEGTI